MLKSKKSKRIVCFFLTLVLILGIAVPVFAVSSTYFKINGAKTYTHSMNGITLSLTNGTTQGTLTYNSTYSYATPTHYACFSWSLTRTRSVGIAGCGNVGVYY